jgi:sialate O-acetylesterase
MVLQQKQSAPIWGWDEPGTKVTVTFAGQTKTAETGGDGKWTVKLDPMPANAQPQAMTIKGTGTKELQDILIGEVWMCSGQSNMGFRLGQDWNGDLEALASRHPQLRLFKLPLVGTQELKTDINAQWEETTPQSSPEFSAVGLLFGRYLHEVLGVPVGLIGNAWGGSSAEAWVRRSTLEGDPRFKELIARWKQTETTYDAAKVKTAYEAAVATWKEKVKTAKAAGNPPPAPPAPPRDEMAGQHRPGNIFAGMLNPTLGFAMKGVVWYQGESNASRAWEYRALFPFMIEQWRKEWKQGDFPFYWVQLADYLAEKPEPGDSNWAELREAQTLAMKLPNTGQCVITDLGEGKDIHPKNKHDVAARLVRWALAKDYGMKIPYRSPEFKSMEVKGNKVVVTLDMFGSALRPFDVKEAVGFAVCGEDKMWHWASGTLLGKDTVEVWSDKVAQPTAVRYAWADNPVCNLFSNEGLPVTPFRTDDFEMLTKPKPVAPKPAPAAPAKAKPQNQPPQPKEAESNPATKKAA